MHPTPPPLKKINRNTYSIFYGGKTESWATLKLRKLSTTIFELCDNIISRRDQNDLNEQSLLPLSAL